MGYLTFYKVRKGPSMKKLFRFIIFTLTLTFILSNFATASAKEYKSAYGNYSLILPEEIVPLYEGPTALSFYHQNMLVLIDVLDLPTNLQSIKPTAFNTDQISLLEGFLTKNQGYPSYRKVSSSFQNIRNKDSFCLTLENTDNISANRKTIVMKVIFINKKKLLNISINANNLDLEKAETVMKKLTETLKMSEPKPVKSNYFNNKYSGYTIDLPLDWQTKTIYANNIIQLEPTTNTSYAEKGIIRSFETNEYAQYTAATGTELNKLENEFVDRITKYASNTTINKHNPVSISGLNGVWLEETIKNQNDTIYLIDCYLFTANKGYQFKFSTNEPIINTQHQKAFTDSIYSFKKIN